MNILQIDGGGIKGIIPALVLEELERQCRRPLYQVFDLIIGTSTGAIIGGGLAAGVPAEDISNFYLTDGIKLFSRKRFWSLGIFPPLFKREKFRKIIGEVKNPDNDKKIKDIHLNELKTKYIATTFNLCSQRTHFIKSFIKDHENYKLIDVISWSALSAAYIFGSIPVDPYKWYKYEADAIKGKLEDKAVFQDGGQGMYNNTLSHVLIEILANYNYNAENYILSLGTGTVDHTKDYNTWVKRSRHFREKRNFSSAFTNQALRESAPSQLIAGRYVAQENSNIRFTRIDEYIPENVNKPFSAKRVEDYEVIGNRLRGEIANKEVVKELTRHLYLQLDRAA